uniref:cyclin-dependent kinase 2-associated protein 1-like n=1 Tax=Jaculus jaculus TaxID=51337 RepID=UPI001E1B1C28|nr:cyclin-dependent kinase 2-associated protein 1-like [Jaculus jaculus]
MATSSQYRQLLRDYGPPSLGCTQGTGNSQVPQSKYAELLAITEELEKEIRPTYAGSKSAMERLKRGIIHARGLVWECLAETEPDPNLIRSEASDSEDLECTLTARFTPSWLTCHTIDPAQQSFA